MSIGKLGFKFFSSAPVMPNVFCAGHTKNINAFIKHRRGDTNYRFLKFLTKTVTDHVFTSASHGIILKFIAINKWYLVAIDEC